MSKRLRCPRTVISVCLATVLAGFCLACGPSDPGSDDVRDALGGSRYVGPALADLPLEHECSFSDDFLPVIRCGEPSNEQRLLRLDRDLAVRVAAEPTDDQLRAKALVRLAPGPKLRDEAGRAVTYLEEALQDEEDPQRRARLLADLSGAYLLWAEETQSPIEVVAGLEAALESEELVPGLDDAVFNRRLALVQLGVDQPEDVEDERLLHDLAEHLRAAARGPEEPGCISVSEFGRRMDEWSSDPAEDLLARIRQEASCWEKAQDRFVADLLIAAQTDAGSAASDWIKYRKAQRSLGQKGVGNRESILAALSADSVPAPIRVEAMFMSALEPYFEDNYSAAENQLLDLYEKATELAYYATAAKSMRVLALISGMRAQIGEAIARNQEAEAAAQRTESIDVLATVLEQRIDLVLTAGREESAWAAFARALRTLHPGHQVSARGLAFVAGSRAAQARGFNRVALRFMDSYVSCLADESRDARIGARLERAQLFIDANKRVAAREDVLRSQKIADHSGDALRDESWVRAELYRLQGLVEDRPEVRKKLLRRALSGFRGIDYDYRVLSIQLAIAKAERRSGEVSKAIGILREALDELAVQVAEAEDWGTATALVGAARPILDETVGLMVEEGVSTVEISDVIGRFLGLQTGRRVYRMPSGDGREARWTTFVRAEEVLHLVESGGEIRLIRAAVKRSELEELRNLLLSQLENDVPESRINGSLSRLAESIFWPVKDLLEDADSLMIVPDDVLAGIPLALLPVARSGESGRVPRLLDRAVISYAPDHRERSEFGKADRLLAVGSRGAGGELPVLARAEDEARSVAALHGNALVLAGERAGRASLMRTLRDLQGPVEAEGSARKGGLSIHLASHFLANTRSPFDSQFVLNGADEAETRLSLRALLDALPSRLDLLYLSACETGRGLPPSPHGLYSLTQAFGASDIRRVITTLWPLKDDVAKELALAFYEALSAGDSPEVAMREAQLSLRDRHPGDWAPFVVYH